MTYPPLVALVAAVALMIAGCTATASAADPALIDAVADAVVDHSVCLEYAIAELDDYKESARNIALAAEQQCIEKKIALDRAVRASSTKPAPSYETKMKWNEEDLDSTIGLVIRMRAEARKARRQ